MVVPYLLWSFFYTLKEGALGMWTSPSLLSGSNWSIKCWKSIMYLGRWDRLTYWRRIVLCLVDKAGQLCHTPAVKLCPKGVRHRGWHILMYPKLHRTWGCLRCTCQLSYLKLWLCCFACWLISREFHFCFCFFKKYIPSPDLEQCGQFAMHYTFSVLVRWLRSFAGKGRVF